MFTKENPFSQEGAISTEQALESCALNDFKRIPEQAREWVVPHDQLPEDFQVLVQAINRQTTLIQALRHIQQLFFSYRNRPTQSTTSFEESRYSTLKKTIEQGILSCGALANVCGESLRSLGVPVRLVDGVYTTPDGQVHNHAWLEVFHPIDQDWLEVDPTKPTLTVPGAIQRNGVYHSWEEMRQQLQERSITPSDLRKQPKN